MKNMTNAAKIAALKPAARVLLSEFGGVSVYAERSGDGRTLRFVRERETGFEVFRTVGW